MSPSTVIDVEVKPSAELELPPPDPPELPELPELPSELPPPQAASTHAAAVATAAVVRRALFMRSSSISPGAAPGRGKQPAGPPAVQKGRRGRGPAGRGRTSVAGFPRRGSRTKPVGQTGSSPAGGHRRCGTR